MMMTWPAVPRYCVVSFLVMWASGCATKRVVTIHAMPSDAQIWVDGVRRPQLGQVSEEFVYNSDAETHRITASRKGYIDKFETLTRGDTRTDVLMQLKVETFPINIIVEPVAAIVKVDDHQ